MRFASLLGAISAFGAAVTAVNFKPARPPAIPLALSSPYVNMWLRGDTLPGNWATHWSGNIIGMTGFVAVDGTVYNWMGAPGGPGPVTQTDVEYTSTKTVFTFNVAGKIKMTATFLSPVYPDDLVKKSLQYSYVEVSAVTLDGASHSVNVYLDTSAEWFGDKSMKVWWDSNVDSGVRWHRVHPTTESLYKESNEQPNWGSIFFATPDKQGLTYQTGADVDVRGQFINNRRLANTMDTNSRAINDRWPVFALAHDFGSVGSSTVSTVFGIGVCQVPTIRFFGAGSAIQELQAPWYGRWSDGIYAMADWVNNYASEAAYSATIDKRVQDDAFAAGGSDYAIMCTLAVRQAFAGLQPAIGSTGKQYLFLKEISSNSDIQTVDVIYPTYPILTYFNSTLLKLLLDPLFENQESGHFPKSYALHDLGTFPNAVGFPNGNDYAMPVEESGNMIIMALAYAQKSGDTNYLNQHWTYLEKWAGFLISDGLIPGEQLSTDDFAGPLVNQTNLALKAIIGIGAMGKIAQLTGRTDTYTATAKSYIEKWYEYGINTNSVPPHSMLKYGDTASHGLLYNLYADKTLGLNLVKKEIYDGQSEFYSNLMGRYGVPLDTRATYTKMDWEAWAAAVASPETRALFYKKIVAFINNTSTRIPMTDWYEASSGNAAGFTARPVVGGLFAQLVL
ncbi:DUF1793-domain-containing protein [Thozetella sp. PMI_491]|nr:DUF1793-domain-containing protein [Thozetella sp. PMI_491]